MVNRGSICQAASGRGNPRDREDGAACVCRGRSLLVSSWTSSRISACDAPDAASLFSSARRARYLSVVSIDPYGTYLSVPKPCSASSSESASDMPLSCANRMRGAGNGPQPRVACDSGRPSSPWSSIIDRTADALCVAMRTDPCIWSTARSISTLTQSSYIAAVCSIDEQTGDGRSKSRERRASRSMYAPLTIFTAGLYPSR